MHITNRDFGANKTPVKTIKRRALGGTYFRDIYPGVNGKWYRKAWKEFDESKNIHENCYCTNYYDVNVDKYRVKCETSLWFWENNGWSKSLDPFGWFHWYFRYWLGWRSDKRKIARWKGIVNWCEGKLVKMIKDGNGKFADYSNEPKIRQTLLHWGYELVESDLWKWKCYDFFFTILYTKYLVLF